MINIIGTILGSSGYDIHTRSLAKALGKLTDVRLTINAAPGWERLVTDKELEMLKKPSVDDEINLIVTNPMLWRMNTNSNRNWAFLVWEGDRIPACYLEECLNPEIEYIFVPSEHTKKALYNTLKNVEGVIDEDYWNNKVKVMPHGVDLEKFYPKDKPTKFTFVANKGFRNLEDRGGIQYLIKAYLEEFTQSEDVQLILKINPAYGIPNIQAMISQLAPRNVNLPLINIDIGLYPYDKLVDLYNRGHVFVSPTRAESYNLPCIEAMACGLPVVTTNYGGQTDFCSDETGWIIGGELTEIKHEVLYEGIKWLTPDVKQLRVSLREAFTNQDKVKKLGQKALEVARNNTWDKTAKKIADLV